MLYVIKTKRYVEKIQSIYNLGFGKSDLKVKTRSKKATKGHPTCQGY